MLENRFTRLEQAIGSEEMHKLQEKTVLVIGLGGVGGYAVEALSRSNIGTLIIIDYDKVNITNINRQIIADDKTINKYKTDCFKERIKDINPNCNVIALTKKYDKSLNDELFNNYKIDYVVDAFDDVKGKIDLINYCHFNKIKIISSMGMANRFDPTKITITKLSKTEYDPLARKLRGEIKFDIPVVSSTEMPIKRDVLSSVAFIPSVAGLMLASYVINDLRSQL